MRLLSSLRSRGINHDDAETALNEVLDEETEFQLLVRFMKKYAKKINSKNESEIRSVKYLLKNEGFSSQTIQKFFID